MGAFKKINLPVTCLDHDSVLDAIEESGESWPSGCRAGSCGVCLARVIKGQEYFLAPRPAEELTLAGFTVEGGRLLCQAQFDQHKLNTLKDQNSVELELEEVDPD